MMVPCQPSLRLEHHLPLLLQVPGLSTPHKFLPRKLSSTSHLRHVLGISLKIACLPIKVELSVSGWNKRTSFCPDPFHRPDSGAHNPILSLRHGSPRPYSSEQRALSRNPLLELMLYFLACLGMWKRHRIHYPERQKISSNLVEGC
jgi:hypothetical protein